jgi:hypothetical protein
MSQTSTENAQTITDFGTLEIFHIPAPAECSQMPSRILTGLGTRWVSQNPPTAALSDPSQTIIGRTRVYALSGQYPYIPSELIFDEEDELEEGEISESELSNSLKSRYAEATAKAIVARAFTADVCLEKHVEEHGIDCSICKEPLNLSSKSKDHWLTHQPVKSSKCGHVFGAKCLWEWVYDWENSSCPYCRSTLAN